MTTTTVPRLTIGPDGRLRHRVGRAEISNDLAGWIADDLVAPGLLDPSAFERTFVSVVLSTDPEPATAWTAFYRNTLAELAAGGAPGGTNAGMAPVHTRAVELATGSVVELGCCFGFLSLALARAGHAVTAVDLSAGTVRLLASVAPALGSSVDAVTGDATAVPLADSVADTVFAVHLLEHLPPGVDAVVLAEMLRLARRRVVVAVPYEDEPEVAWGHVRTFDAAALDALGAATGHPYRVDDHHGVWLVIDVP
ncbi:MAG: class I SAM-dependent methyltransferase [Pseudonocardia sp.]|nr:class I SAM-dependent methyltransferase [Pseudonocardia sp.]